MVFYICLSWEDRMIFNEKRNRYFSIRTPTTGLLWVDQLLLFYEKTNFCFSMRRPTSAFYEKTNFCSSMRRPPTSLLWEKHHLLLYKKNSIWYSLGRPPYVCLSSLLWEDCHLVFYEKTNFLAAGLMLEDHIEVHYGKANFWSSIRRSPTGILLEYFLIFYKKVATSYLIESFSVGRLSGLLEIYISSIRRY